MVLALDRKLGALWQIPLSNTGQNRYLAALRMGPDPHKVSQENGYGSLKAHIVVWIVDACVFVVSAHHMTFTLKDLLGFLVFAPDNNELSAAEAGLILTPKVVEHIHYSCLLKDSSIFLGNENVSQFAGLGHRIA